MNRRALTVELQPADFVGAVKNDPCYCPVAKALRRITGRKPHVGVFFAQLDGDFYELPLAAADFILGYDRSGKQKLVKFTVTPITPTTALGIFYSKVVGVDVKPADL